MKAYLDNAATSAPKAPGVAGAVAEALELIVGSPGRGGHRASVAASRIIEGARMDLAWLFGADPARTLLGPSSTFWLNTVISGTLNQGDRVIVSSLEHNSVMRPLRRLEEELDLEIVIAKGDKNGIPSPDEISELTSKKTSLVCLTHASNVTGSILPIKELISATTAPTLIDASQTAGVLDINFKQIGASALVCSGHKGLLGPSGTGAMFLSPNFNPRPLVVGGTGSRSQSELIPNELPDKYESGTPNVPGIAGLSAAIRWILNEKISSIHQNAFEITEELLLQLRSIPGLIIPCRAENALPTISFILEGTDVGELATWLDREKGIMLRAGLHCAPMAHKKIGTFPDGTLRVSIGPTTTWFEAELLVEALTEKATKR